MDKNIIKFGYAEIEKHNVSNSIKKGFDSEPVQKLV